MLLGGQTREFNMLPFLPLRTGFDVPLKVVTQATPFADEILSFAWKNGKPLEVSEDSHCIPWALSEHCIGVEPWGSGGPWPSNFFSPQSRRGRVFDRSIIILS